MKMYRRERSAARKKKRIEPLVFFFLFDFVYASMLRWIFGGGAATGSATTRLRGTLYVHTGLDLTVETARVLYVWISGMGAYVRIAELGPPTQKFPAELSNSPDGVARCNAVDVDVQVNDAALCRRDAALCAAVTCRWSAPPLAPRTETVVGVCSLFFVHLANALQRGTFVGGHMKRIGSEAAPRAAVAFLPSTVPGQLPTCEPFVRPKAVERAAAITAAWTRFVQGCMKSRSTLDAATSKSHVDAWATDAGDLPPEVYFAPRYPAALFGEATYSRCLQRARFITGSVPTDRVLRWCAEARTDTCARICACTLLGRMLAGLAQCMVYTPDVVLHPASELHALPRYCAEALPRHPGVAVEHVEHFTEPGHTLTGDCDEAAKLTLAACLAFQRRGAAFADPELRALAEVARAYVFSAVQCHVPLGAGTSTNSGTVDELDAEVGCSAHFVCVGIPRRVYFAACARELPRGDVGDGAALPTLVVDGTGLVHPLLRGSDALEGIPTVPESVAPTGRSAALATAVHAAVDGMREAYPYLLDEHFSRADARLYLTFVHAFTWPVPGLAPAPPARATFACADGKLGVPADALASQRGFAVHAWPQMPPVVVAAARTLERLQPPVSNRYASFADRPTETPTSLLAALGDGLRRSDDRSLGSVRDESVATSGGSAVLTIGFSALPVRADALRRFFWETQEAVVSAGGPVARLDCMAHAVSRERGELLLRYHFGQ